MNAAIDPFALDNAASAPSELDRAREHVATAEAKMSAANAAVDAAERELAQLEQQLGAALDAERIAAESDAPDAAKFSARVADVQGAIRRKGHRVNKLKTEAELARVAWVDAQQVLARRELEEAHRVLGDAADEFTRRLESAAEAKRDYYAAIETVRTKRAGVDGLVVGPVDKAYAPGHVKEITLRHVTCQLLESELYTGRALAGPVILSAADIRRDFGQEMPLIR